MAYKLTQQEREQLQKQVNPSENGLVSEAPESDDAGILSRIRRAMIGDEWKGIKEEVREALPTGIRRGPLADWESLKRAAPTLHRVDQMLGIGAQTIASAAQAAQYPASVYDPYYKDRETWIPNISKAPGAFAEFVDEAKQGELDAAIKGYQDEMEAGKYFWPAAELAGAAIAPGGLAAGGRKVISQAAPAAERLAAKYLLPSSARGVREGVESLGKVLEAPLKIEEGIGRAIQAPFLKGGVVRKGLDKARGRPDPTARDVGGRPRKIELAQTRTIDDVVEEIQGDSKGVFGRKSANLPVLRSVSRLVNPPSVADTVEALAISARKVLLFEGRQQAQQFMTHLTSLFGKQEQVFGKLDAQGLFADATKVHKSLIGKAPTDIRQSSKVPSVRKLLTLEQRKWMDTAQRMEAANSKFLRDNGIDIKYLKVGEGGIEYAGRRVVGKFVDGEFIDARLVGEKIPGRPFGTAGKKVGQEKERMFETQQEAIEKGYRYLTDEEALYYNIKQAQKRVADKKFAEYVIAKSPNLVKKIKGKRTRAMVGEVTSKRIDAMNRLWGNKDFEKVYFRGTDEGKKAAELMAKELEDMIPNIGILDPIAKVNALGRFFMLTMDMGHPLIQHMFLAGYNPRVWSKGLRAFVRTWMDVAIGSNTWHHRQVANNRSILNKYRIITSLDGNEYTEAAQRGGLLEKVPFVGRGIIKVVDPFVKAFDAAMDLAGIELAKSMDSTFKPQTAKEIAEMTAFINEIRGLASTTRLGVSPMTRAVENFALLAPRYNRSIAAFLWDAMTDGGLRGLHARDALIRSLAGLSAITMAFKMVEYRNKTDEKDRTTWDMIKYAGESLNPSSPEFVLFDIGGTMIGPGTKVRSLLALLGNTFMAAKDDPKSLYSASMANPFLRFGRGNASPVLSDAVDILTGHNYIGEPTGWRDGWDLGFVDNLKRSGKTTLLPDIMPIWAQTALLESGGAGQRATRGGVEFFGGRAHPLRRSQLAQKIADREGLGDYEELDARVKHLIDRRVAEEMEAAGRLMYPGELGPKYKEKDDADKDLLMELQSVSEKYLRASIDSMDYAPRLARKKYNEALNERRGYLYGVKWDEEKGRTIGGLLEDLYDMDEEQEEPEPETKEHLVWRYGQTFNEAINPETGKLDFDILEKVQGKFWASLTPADGDTLLRNLRVLEGEYDSSMQNMVDAGRYAGSVRILLGGETVGYYDLEDHKMVETYIASVTGISRAIIREYLKKTIPEREAARKGRQGELIGKALDKAARNGGMLWRLRANFVDNAPKGWKQAMLEAGYRYQGKDDIEDRVFAKVKAGASLPKRDYKMLYRNMLIGQ